MFCATFIFQTRSRQFDSNKIKPKTVPEERSRPISVVLERGLNVSRQANIQPIVIESQI